jgi:soluble lytic murein transglycosylase-like protein
MRRTAVFFPLIMALVFFGLCVWVLRRLQPMLLSASMAEQSSSSAAFDNPAHRPTYDQPYKLSPIFTPEVQHWAQEIKHWSEAFQLDPNFAALVMQIESCGHPDVVSPAGAIGLFQVMPFHFSTAEDPLDPQVNAEKGLSYFARALELAEGRIDLALAGYNGGHGVIHRPPSSWPAETQRYVGWGTGIYQDLSQGKDASPTLQAWLEAGGSALCHRAASALAQR